ncbi:hypothetical protein TrRE_jg11314, partial [Triparma retinervis]
MGCMSHIDSGDEEKDITNAKFDEATNQIASRLKRSITEKKNDSKKDRKNKTSQSTMNTFVTIYDIDSDEGKEIYDKINGLGGELIQGIYQKIAVCNEPFRQGKWFPEAMDLSKK